MVWCFRCNKVKPADEFKNNHRGYQIKSRQGKVFSCNDCTIKWTTDNLTAVRYDFAENKWDIHRFSCGEEAIKFLENERSTDIHQQDEENRNRVGTCG